MGKNEMELLQRALFNYLKGGENLCIERKRGNGKMPAQEGLTLEKKVENHEERLQELEKYRVEQEKLNTEIRNQLTVTENTVLKESGKQQEMTQKLIDHVLENDTFSRQSANDRKNFTQQQIWKVAGVLAGSGGLIYLLIEKLFTK
ncbi:hypothetical protein AAHB53_22690 [Niallia circulans]